MFALQHAFALLIDITGSRAIRAQIQLFGGLSGAENGAVVFGNGLRPSFTYEIAVAFSSFYFSSLSLYSSLSIRENSEFN